MDMPPDIVKVWSQLLSSEYSCRAWCLQRGRADKDVSSASQRQTWTWPQQRRTRLCTNGGLMLARWASINPPLGQGIMIGGELILVSLSGSVWYIYFILMTQAKTAEHWVDAGLALPAGTQYCSNGHSLCLGPPTALCPAVKPGHTCHWQT